jgi:hypothetical protein
MAPNECKSCGISALLKTIFYDFPYFLLAAAASAAAHFNFFLSRVAEVLFSPLYLCTNQPPGGNSRILFYVRKYLQGEMRTGEFYR